MSIDVEELATTVVAPSQLRTDLEAALARLDRIGWLKAAGDPVGPNCMIGHLMCGPCSFAEAGPAAQVRLDTAMAALRPLVFPRSIPRFNDAPETTLADVRGVFCRAIEAVS